MYVGKVLEVSDEIIEAVIRLVPQLGAHKVAPTREELVSLINSESSTLWIARYPDENGEIAGILTIAIYRVPTGLRSIVEDVVVDSQHQRKGIAKGLMQAAIKFARDVGANGVVLTSNPQREAANKLYQSMGFQRRATNSYFYKFK